MHALTPVFPILKDYLEKNKDYITIDSTPLLEEVGKVWKIEYNPSQTVQSFVDDVFFT